MVKNEWPGDFDIRAGCVLKETENRSEIFEFSSLELSKKSRLRELSSDVTIYPI